MRSGVSILWVIDPQDEKLTVWRPGALPQDFAPPATVSASPVLESFELDLQQLFDALRD
jgi:Uma2 family endonuclease